MASVLSTYCVAGGPVDQRDIVLEAERARARQRREEARDALELIETRRRRHRCSSGPQARVREPVEHAVDQARLLAGEEGMSDVEIFADDDPRRHVDARQQLVGAGAQDRAQHRLEPLQAASPASAPRRCGGRARRAARCAPRTMSANSASSTDAAVDLGDRCRRAGTRRSRFRRGAPASSIW